MKRHLTDSRRGKEVQLPLPDRSRYPLCAAAAFAWAAMVFVIGAQAANSSAAEVARSPQSEARRLLQLAEPQFSNLTRCERAVLEWADAQYATRGYFAACGPGEHFDDPTNDPKCAAKWDHQRDIRVALIRWLFVDPDAVKLVDPEGIQIRGARIVGELSLVNLRLPFGLALERCEIPEPVHIAGTEIPSLDLDGS